MVLFEIVIALSIIYGLYNKFFKKDDEKDRKRKYKQPNKSPAESESDDSVFDADAAMHQTKDNTYSIPGETDEDDPGTFRSTESEPEGYQSTENDPESYTENSASLEQNSQNMYQASLENKPAREHRRGDIVRDTPEEDITRLKEGEKRKKKSRIQLLVKDKHSLADAIILSEVLGKPIAHKKKRRG